MISNLLTSLLIATAVGGTTATAFGNEPQKASSESQEQYQIRVTENILHEVTNMDSLENYGNNAPYYTTNETLYGANILSNYWYKDYNYYSQNKWNVENRTYIKLSYARQDNTNVDYNDAPYDCLEYLSITKITTYVDLVHIDANNPIHAVRKVIQDQDEVTIDEAIGTNVVETRNQRLQSDIIDNFIIGNTPPNLAYQSDSIGYILNQIRPVSQLYNNDTFNYNDAEEDYIGNDHVDFSYNYDAIEQTNYLITYARWGSSYIAWIPNDQRPDIDIQTVLTRYSNIIDITYTQLVVIDSQGNTTPVITQEIIDIPSIMYTVLTMPFSFISQAFNLTLFPNTPYQVNFSNIFLVILALLVILFVAKIIIRMIR